LNAIHWSGGALRILDQRELPSREVWIEARTWQDVADAINSMAVRGAPLIGVAAAYGMALAEEAGEDLKNVRSALAATRPTAVNLCHALDRVLAYPGPKLESAREIEAEERAANDAIAAHGAARVPQDAGILTICNTGSLAAPGVGTALGIVRKAHELGKAREIFLCETRPRLQGLRLSAWELARDHIPFRVIADSAAAWAMASGKIQFVVAGADRIAANGDTANKIGTYALALLAQAHNIPFVIAAPSSTIDRSTKSGAEIVIEERAAEELTEIGGLRIAPVACQVWNPAFDVTPRNLISHFVTEQGVLSIGTES
jgi:methylthioribose-1-phosphate isomerase